MTIQPIQKHKKNLIDLMDKENFKNNIRLPRRKVNTLREKILKLTEKFYWPRIKNQQNFSTKQVRTQYNKAANERDTHRNNSIRNISFRRIHDSNKQNFLELLIVFLNTHAILLIVCLEPKFLISYLHFISDDGI